MTRGEGGAPAGKVLVGISSWTEPTLVKAGTFYPASASSPEKRLRFYSTQFPIVEVDSTYYYPPSEHNSVLWIERTPPEFTFNVKAYSLLTGHPTRLDSLYKDVREALPAAVTAKKNLYRDAVPPELVDEVWQRFRDALMPLHSSGKLGAVLFQFPQWFVIGGANREYVLECKERMGDMQIAVEFRHRTWLAEENRERTLGFLQEHSLPFVAVDMPQGFDSSVPPVAAVTSPRLAMIRFHGRDRGAWATTDKGAAERFRYDYRDDELEEWVPKIRSMASEARETHVLMNNCYRDHAVNNARSLWGFLDD